jgi:hypothetical protein
VPGVVNNTEDLGTKLMNMAGYGKISATAFMVRRGIVLSNDVREKPQLDENSESSKKIYIPTYLNKLRMVGCVDSGSDITILQYSYFKRIFNSTNDLNDSDVTHITTFSDSTVPVLGKIHTLIRLSKTHPGINLPIYIIKDIPNVPKFLLGNDMLKAGLGSLSYTGRPDCPEPRLIFNYPVYHRCEVFHESPKDIYICMATCFLDPYEVKEVEFFLPQAAPVIRTDHILITGQVWDTISVIPSRSDIELISGLNAYSATGCVVNLSNNVTKCYIVAKYELINDSTVINLINENRGKLKTALPLYPLGREVLAAKSTAKIDVPTITVHQVTLSQDPTYKISDLNFADTIMDKEPSYFGEAEIKPEIIEPNGLDLPTIIYKSAAEAIDLNLYTEEVRPFIKDIFIDKYPQVVALHSLDAGNLSLTLGFTQLRLREGENLPRSKRIFHVSPTDQRHLDDLCDFLIKFGYIMRSPMSPNGCHLFGMSAYLVPRSKANCLGRLIIDYSPVNQLIQSPSAVIPEINATIQFLQGKALYTSLDLKYAYLSLRIDEESKKLTTFLTPTGSFQWLSLPTGAANSPAYFTDACNRMLHFEPEYDQDGNLIYEANNVVKQKRSVLKEVCNYFDDILITSKLKPTFGETLKSHFINVEEAIQRLAFHGAKISVMKCEFARSKILFLGWYISHDFVIADPRRIQKVKEFKFPDSKKAVRAFLGLVNSLRRVLTLNVIKQISILTPLTSSKDEFKATEKHRQAFEEIKTLLTQAPLFAHLIDETAPKYLWVDAATASGVLGAVLAQKVRGKKDEKVIPTCLDLDDEVHRFIYDKEFPYEPAKLFTSLPIEMPKPSALKTKPPKISHDEKLLGFTDENWHDSFFWSTISILAIYGCTLPVSTIELRQKASRKLKSGILNNKLKDFTFNLKYDNYKQFLDDFNKGTVGLDPELYLAEALALSLYRPMIFISSLKRHKDKPIFHFNHGSDKPPLIYGIYEKEGKEIFLPYYHNKNTEFKLDHLKDCIQIIAYVAKVVPETFKSRPILDLEVFAILTALYSLQRFISGVKVTLLTDSRVLFYLFSPKVGNSCVKIKRWCLKLLSDYPQVNLQFVRSSENLADFLTREGLPPGDCEKFNLHNVIIDDFYKHLPKTEFSLTEWINFVGDHPEYLTVNSQLAGPKDKVQKVLKAVTLSISRGLENVKDALSPLEILKEKLSRANIISAQKREFARIYEACLAAPNFEIEYTEIMDLPHKFKLVSDLLMVDKDFYKILVPPSMLGVLLSYTHLLGHKGLNRMLADLQSYYFANMNTVTKKFIQCCYSCFLTNKGNRKTKVGVYPTPAYPFEEITMDLAENLNTVNGFSHLLITQCTLSDFVIIIPLKSKTASEVTRAVLNSLFQQFNIRRIHTDNGPCFRSSAWLETMAALNIQIIGSSALHPSGRGQVERLVGIIKIMLKRMLAIKADLNWEYLPYLCAKILNNTISPKTNFRPQEMVFGNQNSKTSNFDTEQLTHIHPLVQNNRQHIEKLNKDINQMTQIASERLTQLRLITNEKVNKNRISKTFKINDYVFVLDRYSMPGNTRPLKTRFHPSPYVVIRPLFTTTLVKRLGDGFTALYSNDDLKKYEGRSPLFANIPKEISQVLLYSFQDLLQSDLSIITQYDSLEPPSSIELFQSELPLNDEPNVGNMDNLGEGRNVPRPFQDVSDEFDPDQDKNLTPADDFTPVLQPATGNDDMNQVIQNNVPAGTDLPRANSNPGTDQDETDLVNSLQNISKNELEEDLLELENESFPVDNVGHVSDDSEQEDEGGKITHETNRSDNNSMNLRSGRKVQFRQ